MADSDLKAYWGKEMRKTFQSTDADQESVIEVSATPSTKKRVASKAPPIETPPKKAKKAAKKAVALVVESESSDSDDSIKPSPLPLPRKVPARSSRAYVSVPPPPLLSVDSASVAAAAAECINTTPASVAVVPLPTVSVPLSIAPVIPSNAVSSTMTRMSHTAVESNNFFNQEPGPAMSLPNFEANWKMFTGIAYDNMKSKFRVRELERRLEQYEEAEERAKFQESMAALFQR
jgi:hypothetical protein